MPRGSSGVAKTTDLSEANQHITKTRLQTDGSRGSARQDDSSSDEESEQDPGEIFDPNQYKKENNDTELAGDNASGAVQTKQDEEIGKGTIKGSSIGESNGNMPNEPPNLLPNLNEQPIKSATVKEK